MNIIDAWIKAAIERKTLEIDYYSSKTKKEYTTRKVQPDYYGWDVNFRQTGLWGFCLLRGKIRCFKEESVLNWRYDGQDFEPIPESRSRELLAEYEKKYLADISWSN